MDFALDAPVLVLQHESTVGPGNLTTWLDDHDILWRLVEAPRAQYPAGPWRAIVVLGSEASVYDDSLDWLRAEKRYLQPLVDAGVPLLGLCFGAQLLALLTGGEVHRAPHTIRGWTDVRSADPLLGGRWLSWHGDEIVPPGTADILAQSATCVEAFSVGRHLGLQFHPEVTRDIVDSWTAEDFGAPGLEEQARRVQRDTAACLTTATTGAAAIYERFFSLARELIES
jgi:GMP synthase (glutamine-hydrolysing)